MTRRREITISARPDSPIHLEEPVTEANEKPIPFISEAWTYNHRNTIKPMDRYNIGDPVELSTRVADIYTYEMPESTLGLLGLWSLHQAVNGSIGGYQYVVRCVGCIVFCHSYMDYLKFRAEVPQGFGGV